MTRDIYEVLSLKQDNIRLLTIDQGCPEDPLNCRLEVVSLAQTDHKPYETVSYSWGAARLSDYIYVNNTSLQIPKAAAITLRRIRSISESRVVWIDSVCINQRNLPERNSQVRLMHNIYQQCTGNLIYAGDDTELARRAFPAILSIANEAKAAAGETYDLLRDYLYGSGDGQWHYSDRALACRPDFHAITQLYELRWFERLWVVQEAVMAASNTIFLGQESLDFAEVLTATAWLEHKTPCLSRDQQDVPNLRGFRTVQNMWLLKGRVNCEPEPEPWNRLLNCAPYGECQNPRDNVFGLLGLYQRLAQTDHIPLALAPDYKKSFVEVLRDATRHAFEERGELEVMERLPLQGRGRPEGLPSWVSQWFYPVQDDDPRALTTRYNARGSVDQWEKTEVLPALDPNVLRLKGIILDRVEMATAAINADDFSTPIKEIERIAEHAEKGALAVGMTLLTAEWFDGCIATEEQAKAWDIFKNSNPQNQNDLLRPSDLAACASERVKLLAGFSDMWVSNCTSRCFFSTKGRFVGIGPPGMQAGDLLVFLRGGHMPFVLREAGATFKILGPTYTYGLMNGEGLRGYEEEGTSNHGMTTEEFYALSEEERQQQRGVMIFDIA